MDKYDAVVIGGGVLGCFAARELCRYDISAALIEAREDVCTGISRSNTAIIYSGCDNKPKTLKAQLTVRANRGFQALCQELDVPFSRCGSLTVSYSEKSDAVLHRKLENGRLSGVPGLSLISGEQAQALEPSLGRGVSAALYAQSTGTADPWQLCYAAYENAVANGCNIHLNTKVLGIKRCGSDFVIETDRGEILTRAIVNCAGLYADKVHELLFPPKVRIFPDGADYLVLERGASSLSHIIMHERPEGGKGLTAVPTTNGNILLGPTERPCGEEDGATNSAGLALVRQLTAQVLPEIQLGKVIRSFSALRPNPHELALVDGGLVPGGSGIGSFVVECPEPSFISFIGIKTPGLTCAGELGRLAAEKLSAYLKASLRSDFQPSRRAITRLRTLPFEGRRELVERNSDYGDVICRCEDISRAEVLEAIKRGAVTVDGVKRRCGALLGVCQGSRCGGEIAAILAHKLGIPEDSVTKSGGASFLLEHSHG